jgi:hypothetical protein
MKVEYKTKEEIKSILSVERIEREECLEFCNFNCEKQVNRCKVKKVNFNDCVFCELYEVEVNKILDKDTLETVQRVRLIQTDLKNTLDENLFSISLSIR